MRGWPANTGGLAVGEAGDEGCPGPDQHGGIAETEGHRLDDQLPVAPPPCAHVPDYSQREPRPCTPMNGAGAGAAVTDLLGSTQADLAELTMRSRAFQERRAGGHRLAADHLSCRGGFEVVDADEPARLLRP